MVEELARNTKEAGVTLFGLGDRRQGIVHVIGPEQGISQPGMLIVCGDSHTSTHGALGALAFGIGVDRGRRTCSRRRRSGSASRARCASPSTARSAPGVTART